MAKIAFDINDLYSKVFGYVGKPFPTMESLGELVSPKRDYYGTPYFMPIRINGIWLPNSPAMSVHALKKIVSTQVVGVGTVKELISIDDYKLTIKGFAINYESDDYPYQDVQLLRELFGLNRSLKIESKLCEVFEINMVVIESLRLPDMVGKQNIQPFEINLLSDKDFDVILVD
jgi:hypothetical protein